MKNFSKKLLAVLVACSCVMAQADHDKTKKLQILIDPAASWFIFRMNDGTGLIANPLVLRPTGASYLANGLIYPGGTIDTENQASFLVDKDGNPLTPANSIGTFWEQTSVLTDYSLLPVPPAGAIINLAEYSFDFKDKSAGEIFGKGFLTSTGVQMARETALKGVFAEQGGTEDNQGLDHQFKVKFIPAPGFTALVIEIKFKKKVHIE